MSERLEWKAWLDPDGYHVWVSHRCRLTVVTNMLPHPGWVAKNQHVVPPVACGMCGTDAQPRVDQFAPGDLDALERWLDA